MPQDTDKISAPAPARESIRAAIDEHKKNNEQVVKAENENNEPKIKDNKEAKEDKKEQKVEIKSKKVEQEQVVDTTDAPDDKELKTKEKEEKEIKEEKKPSLQKVIEKDDTDQEVEAKEDKKEKAPSNEFVPLGLPKEVRAKWSDIPSEAQLHIAKTQKEFNDVKAELGRNVAKYRDLDAVLTPYLPQMQKINVTPAALVQRLLNYSDALAGPQKYQALQQLARDFGIDLSRYNTGNSQQTQQNQDQSQGQDQYSDGVDPALYDYIDQNNHAVNQKLDAIINEFNSSRQSQQSANDVAAEKAVNSWAGFDPATNQYKNKPYFPYVRQAMFQLISNGTIPIIDNKIDLDKAYDTACYLDPEIRERQQEDNAKAVAARKAANAQKVQSAKSASVSIKPAARASSPNNGGKHIAQNNNRQGESVRDSLRRAITEINQ